VAFYFAYWCGPNLPAVVGGAIPVWSWRSRRLSKHFGYSRAPLRAGFSRPRSIVHLGGQPFGRGALTAFSRSIVAARQLAIYLRDFRIGWCRLDGRLAAFVPEIFN